MIKFNCFIPIILIMKIFGTNEIYCSSKEGKPLIVSLEFSKEKNTILEIEQVTRSPLSLNEKGEHHSYLPMQISPFFAQSEVKRWYYAQDPYFRRGYLIFQSIFNEDLNNFFKNYTFLLVRPDAIVSHSLDKIFHALNEYSFEVIQALPIRFDRHMNRLLYFYHLNHAPLERFPLIDLFSEDKNFLVLILKDKKKDTSLEPCRRFRSIKGSVLEEKRSPHHFRAKIQAKRGLLAFIHAPDEAADVIRELSIFFDEADLKQMLNRIILNDHTLSLAELEAILYPEAGYHDLELEGVISRIENACFNKDISGVIEKKIIKLCKNSRLKKKVDWMEFIDLINKSDIEIDKWDILVFCSNCSEDELPYIKSLDE